jgi:hypothetical protein
MESTPGQSEVERKRAATKKLLQEIYNFQIAFLKKMYPLPDFRGDYDVAVLKLKSSMAFDGFVPQ